MQELQKLFSVSKSWIRSRIRTRKDYSRSDRIRIHNSEHDDSNSSRRDLNITTTSFTAIADTTIADTAIADTSTAITTDAEKAEAKIRQEQQQCR